MAEQEADEQRGEAGEGETPPPGRWAFGGRAHHLTACPEV